MIRILNDLALLKEVDEIEGALYSSSELKQMFPEKIVVIRHTSYIYRDVLCEIAREKVTQLDDYIPLGELVDSLSVHKSLIKERINFMKKTGTSLFEYTMISNINFIKLDEEFKYLFQNFQPFLASFQDTQNLVHCRLLGDLKIGFY
ncbi:MAG: hypothetical protein IBX43_05050 [Campylobacterales bacterium]|nr:hypothetical protein [Campylobacterales bacterium]